MEILINLGESRPKVKAALFDFDGTISTLRHGWEGIMEPMMLEMITGSPAACAEKGLVEEVREYIDQSTGIQTYYQMEWLANAVKRYGKSTGAGGDPWVYKAEYNRRLMELVEARKEKIRRGEKSPTDYRIKNSAEFLSALKEQHVEIFAASGTDHPDVVNETEILGLSGYFKEIAGAPPDRVDCSKKAVLSKLIREHRLQGREVAVIGDGKVEIGLGREAGAITLGVASDEDKLCGINPTKRARLIKAGAHAIVGDFGQTGELLEWMGF